MNYRIENKGPFRVIAKRRMVTDINNTDEIPKFWREYFEEGLHEKVCGMMGICEQAKEGCSTWNYGIGCEEKYVEEVSEDFDIVEIPSYTWVIFKCKGPMPNAIQEMWHRVYSEWLPQADYELINDYDIELYTEGNNQSKDYESEIWIPVKEKINK